MVLRQIALIVGFSGMVTLAWAQPQTPNGDPQAVPITGIEYLLIGGGAYGISRLLKNRNKKGPSS